MPLRESILSKVSICYEMVQSTLSSGELIARVEAEFNTLVMPDKNLCYQQDLRTDAFLRIALENHKCLNSTFGAF